MRAKADPHFLTTGDIARDMNVCAKTVGSWIDQGILVGTRFPSTTPGIAHRRVHRRDYESFRRRYEFGDRTTQNLVLAVSCTLSAPDGFSVVSTDSVFDAGHIVSTRFPEVVLVNWAIGQSSASQIAGGCAVIPNYRPILVAVRPSRFGGDRTAFVEAGYPNSIEVATAPALKAIIETTR